MVAASVAGFYGLLLAVPAALLAACVLFALRVGTGPLFVVVVPISVLLAASRRALRAAVPRGSPPMRPGIDVARAAEPGLWALADRASTTAGIRSPDRVRIVFGGSASAFEDRAAPGGSRKRVLVIPLAYLFAMSASELGAVVAHEIGHFAAGDTALGRWFDRAGNALARSARELVRLESVLRFPFLWYARAFFRWTARRAREREFAADAFSVALIRPGGLCGGADERSSSGSGI